MATTDSYGLFWNSQRGDRKYNAESFETWLKKFFTSGVFRDELFVSAVSGMTVSIGNGYTNVDGKVKFFEMATSLTLSAAGATYPRIDTIVVERSDSERNITIKIITGAYSDNPVATAPVRSDGIYQLVLAEIYVGVGVATITQANITDKRPDTTVCGYVAGTVEEMDFSQFTAQWTQYITEFKAQREADFDQWVDETQDDYNDWVAAKQAAYDGWTANKQAAYNTWVSESQAAYTAWITENETEFETWLAAVEEQFDESAVGTLQNEIDDHVGSLVDSAEGVHGLRAEGDSFYVTDEQGVERKMGGASSLFIDEDGYISVNYSNVVVEV